MEVWANLNIIRVHGIDSWSMQGKPHKYWSNLLRPAQCRIAHTSLINDNYVTPYHRG